MAHGRPEQTKVGTRSEAAALVGFMLLPVLYGLLAAPEQLRAWALGLAPGGKVALVLLAGAAVVGVVWLFRPARQSRTDRTCPTAQA